MRLQCTDTVTFLKFYLFILVCGVAASLFRGGSSWIYLAGRPGSLLETLAYSTALLVTASVAIGACVWALASLLTRKRADFRFTVLATLTILVIASLFDSV